MQTWMVKHKRRLFIILAIVLNIAFSAPCVIEGGVDRPSTPCIGEGCP